MERCGEWSPCVWLERNENMMALLPVDILAHPDVVEYLGWPFDFEVDPDLVNQEVDFTIAGNPPVEIVASDGSGNRFVLIGTPADSSRPLLYVDHECRSGVIGRTLAEALQVIVTLPFWRDLVKFSGGGDLDEMRSLVEEFEDDFRDEVLELEEDFDLPAARMRIRTALTLPRLDDPVATLHASVRAFEDRFRPKFIHGDECDSLFGPSVYRPSE